MAIELPWINSAEGLKLIASTDRQTYKAGLPITLRIEILNEKGESKILQTGIPDLQFVVLISRDGKLLEGDDSEPVTDWLARDSFKPSTPIPVGGRHVEVLDLKSFHDIGAPGQYTVKVKKWYIPNKSKRTIRNARKDIDYLEATTSFRIVPPKSKDASGH